MVLMEKPFLSVVIPCRDEEETLPSLKESIEEFLKIGGTEIVFVDDGSRDKTGRLIKELFPFAILVSHNEPLGLGKALVSGTMASKGELVAWYDADSTYDPLLLAEMVDLLENQSADAVTVSPWHPGGGTKGVSPFRSLPSRVVSHFYRAIGPGSLHTYTALFRVHKREAILNALPERSGFQAVAESMLKLLLQKKKVLEVPAELRKRRAGRSKFSFLKAIVGHLFLGLALITGKLGDPKGG